MNRLWYTHTTVNGFKGHDRFHFVLSDGENRTPPQSFFISVHSVQKGKFYCEQNKITIHLIGTQRGSKPTL